MAWVPSPAGLLRRPHLASRISKSHAHRSPCATSTVPANSRPPIESALSVENTAESGTSVVTLGLGLVTAPEVTDPISLKVVGILPSYLETGTYYLNGPGRFEATHKDGQDYLPEHWFDVMGTVHAFRFNADNNVVTYKNKRTANNVIRTVEATAKDDYISIQFSKRFSAPSVFGKLRHMFGSLTVDPQTKRPPIDTNVTLQSLPGKGTLNARTDANVIQRLDPDTLKTVEHYDFSTFNPALKQPLCPSHGMSDRTTGEFFNFVTDYGPGKVTYTVYRISPSGEGEVLTTFKDDPFYIHSFSLTENFIVIILWPCRINLFKLLQTKSFVDGCAFDAKAETKFVVISRKTKSVVSTYKSAPFFCFHTINAFERDDEIIIDLSHYNDATVLDDFRLEKMKKSGCNISKAIPMRFSLSELSAAMKDGPDVSRKASARTLSNIRFEFGVVSPLRELKPYRYMYGMSDNDGKQLFGDVTKLDTKDGNVLRWASPGTLTGEPIFVADPNGKHEDDGSLLALVLDSVGGNSALVVLDARTMTEVARATLPMVLPMGFHGCFRE